MTSWTRAQAAVVYVASAAGLEIRGWVGGDAVSRAARFRAGLKEDRLASDVCLVDVFVPGELGRLGLEVLGVEPEVSSVRTVR